MPHLNNDERKILTRWRLVLGKAAEQQGICIAGGDEEAQRIEALVGYLFGDAAGDNQPKGRQGGLGPGLRDERAPLGR